MCICQAIWMRLLCCPSHIWIGSLFVMSPMGKCPPLVSVSLRLMRQSAVQRCTLFAVVNARWTTSKQKLLVLERQWIQSTERAKQLLIPPVYCLRGTRAYDELQIVVTEVGQVKQTVTLSSFISISIHVMYYPPSLSQWFMFCTNQFYCHIHLCHLLCSFIAMMIQCIKYPSVCTVKILTLTQHEPVKVLLSMEACIFLTKCAQFSFEGVYFDRQGTKWPHDVIKFR